MELQYVSDGEGSNVAIYIDGNNVVDYDDYVNMETAMYVLKYLGHEYNTVSYTVDDEEIDEFNGFPPLLNQFQNLVQTDLNFSI